MTQEYAVIDPWSTEFVDRLVREFRDELNTLLRERVSLKTDPRGLEAYTSMPTPWAMRDPLWRVRPVPVDLIDRRVEITGPAVDPKMAINALNSGASGYMVDGEDSLSPTWANVIMTQRTLMGIVRRGLHVESSGGKRYSIDDGSSTVLHYRPRGLHLTEAHYHVDGARAPACLFDVGLFLFNNAREQITRGGAPYLYLPKLETEFEARFWSRVLSWCEEQLGLPQWMIRVTVLVETLPALLRLEPIIWALRERLTGLNVGRWDYMLSLIRSLHRDSSYVLPDRGMMGMDSPALAEYARWVVRTAHRRGAHAIGGMAAQVPGRRDPAATERAFTAVRRDKMREVELGHDGTWVAHPDLVPVAMEAMTRGMQWSHEQRWVLPGRETLDLKTVTSPMAGPRTVSGLHDAVRTVMMYLDAWLGGNGCVALDGKMEDAATAEISRALLWQWVARGAELDDGTRVDVNRVVGVIRGEAAALAAAGTEPRERTLELLFESIMSPEPIDNIITSAYENIIAFK